MPFRTFGGCANRRENVTMAYGYVSIDPLGLIDRSTVGRFQMQVILLCGLVTLLDGFDIQAIAFVAPTITANWALARGALGPVLAASPIGIMVGALTLSPLGDRFGRRRLLIAALALVGLASLATTFTTTVPGLFGARLLTGLGLGGCMPNAISLTSEYLPSRQRTFFVSLMFCGIPVGGFLGGFIAAQLIPSFGWQIVFWIGGGLPLAMCVLLAAALPESVRYLALKNSIDPEVGTLLERVSPSYRYESHHEFVTQGEARHFLSPLALLSPSHRFATIMLWATCFANMALIYVFLSWFPTFFVQAGWKLEVALKATSVFLLGGAIGGLGLSWFVDRRGPYQVIPLAFAATAIAAVGLSALPWSSLWILPLVFIIGVGTVGAQSCINVVAASRYPTSLRTTGVGWALGIGRVGAIMSPIAGGLALSAGVSLSVLFLVAAIPATICASGLLILGVHDARRRREPLVRAAAASRAEHRSGTARVDES
jgi:AAHS family 4-hydroxybenzoate transporter-like MFS transporter